VTSSGCHTRVSGKYLRNLGVKVCCSAWTVPTPWAAVLDTWLCVVSRRGASAVTSTVVEVVPTANLTSTVVRFDDLTKIEFTKKVTNPGELLSNL